MTRLLIAFHHASLDDSELDFITTSFDSFQSDKAIHFVIYGMPGLRKSHIALQHANMTLTFTTRVHSHVLCMSASMAERLGQGLARTLCQSAMEIEVIRTRPYKQKLYVCG